MAQCLISSLWLKAETNAEAISSFDFSLAYKQDGNAINSLTLFKPMADGNPVLALAFCGAGDMEGTFALGVDFGKGMIWDQPEPVLVTIGRHRETHSMKVMREYLGFDSDEAGSAISELVQSTGSLIFSGPRGLSVSFDLAGAQGALAQLKKHCAIQVFQPIGPKPGPE